MRAILGILASTILTASVLAQKTAEKDRELIANAAANRTAPASAEKAPAAAKPAPVVSDGDDLGSSEAKARAEVALADARLELVLARKAMRSDRFDDAARRAIRSQNTLRALPKDVDASELDLQADGIIARSQKHGVNVVALRVQLGAGGDADNSTTQAAGAVERAPRADRDRESLMNQASLSDATRSDELRRLVEADETRIAPVAETGYPEDWKARAAARAKFATGETARSSPWTGTDGREWFAALYDIRELTYEPPDFSPSFSLDPVEDLRNTLDREALRQRSQIFSGTAEDLAAGIPLLRFFGGVDDYAFRGPKYSREKAGQIAEQVKAFTTQVNEAKIILVP